MKMWGIEMDYGKIKGGSDIKKYVSSALSLYK